MDCMAHFTGDSFRKFGSYEVGFKADLERRSRANSVGVNWQSADSKSNVRNIQNVKHCIGFLQSISLLN